MNETPASPLLSLAEAAPYVRMHPKTLGKHATAGRCESVQHAPGGPRYFTVEMLDRFIRRQTQAVTPPAPRERPRRLAATTDKPWLEPVTRAS